MSDKTGAVMVVGGGIAAIQASLDLADTGYFVYLVEKTSAIGGVMAQLDKTFPTNDCSMCILSPKLVEAGRHNNIEVITLADVQDISGEAGDFEVKLTQRARYVDMDKCIACGECAKKCPKRVDDEFNMQLDKRRSAHVKYPQAVPLKYAIDPKNCIYLTKGKCRACEKVCPADAINFNDYDQERSIKVGSVILAAGYHPYDPGECGPQAYAYNNYKNVVSALQFERMLSASGPWMGHLVRPGDKKGKEQEPKKIAWLQCVGSRDNGQCDKPYCSAVCCMYAIKEAVIAKEHAHDGLDAAIFYMDMRTYGKDFERTYENAKAAGVRFVNSRNPQISELPDGSLELSYLGEDGTSQTEEFDIVVLSQGLEVDKETAAFCERIGVDMTQCGFVKTGSFSPVATSRPGIFACGALAGPKDIPLSVMEASAAACAASSGLSEVRGSMVEEVEPPAQKDVSGETPRVGVFVCSCGINIAGVIDVEAVAEYAKTLPYVEYVANNLFTCSQDTQDIMAGVIKEQGLNRVVVAACSPRTHEPLFQETMVDAGLNKYLFDMANIRNQGSWVHADEPEKATEKAKDNVRMAVAKAVLLQPLKEVNLSITPSATVIGGGISGMTAALELAKQGYPCHLIEQAPELGGNANKLRITASGMDVQAELARLKAEVEAEELITLHLDSKLAKVDGFVGNFTSTISGPEGETQVEHGATVITTGAKELTPTSYAYGQHPMVKTNLEIDAALLEGSLDPQAVNNAVFIQCVGSREPEHPYCSKVCCTHSIQNAMALKKANPDCNIVVLYRDMRTFSERELLWREARDMGVIFLRYPDDDKPEVKADGDGLSVVVYDNYLKRKIALSADLVGLAAAIESHRDQELAQMYKLSLDADGWLLEAHVKLAPVDFATDGVFMAGLAHYPKPIEEAVAQAQAAVSRAVTVLSRKEMTLPGTVAAIDKRKCVGCGVCVEVCPYNAIDIDAEDGLAVVNEATCKGCGTCVAACRSGAPNLKGFTQADIMAMVDAI
jgi:heterodisulfide reductase subunit A